MNPDNLFVIFDVVMFGAGAYCLYSWFYMKTKGVIHDNRMTIPSDMSLGSCRDPQGYMSFIMPRMLIFSLVVLAFGGLNLLGNAFPLPREVQFLCLAVTFAAVLWFAFVIKKSIQLFWPTPLK